MASIPPPGASTSGDFSADAWPPPNRNRVVIVAILGTLLVVLLILTALAAGFFIGQPGDPLAEGTQPPPSSTDKDKDDNLAQGQAQNRHARITIRSVPTGATIFNEERPVGETPMVIEVSNEEGEVRYTVKLEGHQPVTRRFVVSTIPPGGEEWDIELGKLGEEPVAENDDDEEPEVEVEEKKTAQANPTRRNPRNYDARPTRDKTSTQGKAEDKKDSKPVAEKPPVSDDASAAKEDKGTTSTDNKTRKPQINALDGGGSKKPKVNALDDGSSKKPRINALDSGKPKVKALE